VGPNKRGHARITSRLIMRAGPARTLHLTNAWHASSGGVRTFYTALLAHAEQWQRPMTLVVPGERDELVEQGKSTAIYTVAAPLMPALDRRYRIVLPHRYVLRRHGYIWQLIDAHRPDVIEISDKYTLCHLAGLIKRRRGPRPTVVGLSQERMDDTLHAQFGRRRWARTFARWYMPSVYLRQFDAHLANSAYTARELHAAATSGGPDAPLLWRLRDRIHVLPLGVDAVTFTPSHRSDALRDSLLTRMGGTTTSVLVVFAGRLSPEKHVDDLLPAVHAAVRRGVDVRLVIAGDGPARDEIEHAAAAFLRGRCLVLGHLGSRRELAQLLASADVFLHPNPQEPFGIGPLEAMASGTPVVLPRAGGVLSYACDDTAWLAAPGAVGLGEALYDLVARPEDAQRRSQAAVQRARSLTWQAAAERYFEAYDTIDAARRRMREH
jgi:alpha-1,6-mannosyltransferase